jgi:FkbM family methyltransferase
MLRSGAKVEAFEPISSLARSLSERYGDAITVHECAASDSNGFVEIHVPLVDGRKAYGYSSCEKSWALEERFKVATRTIDSFEFSDVGLMKIDVEGHELAVLNGAKDTIKRCRPILIIEAEERHRARAKETVCELLASLGYSTQPHKPNAFNFVFTHSGNSS